jgi:hypothetical protein
VRRVAILTLFAACFVAAPSSADDGEFSGIVVSFGDNNFRELSQWDMKIQWEGSVEVRYSGPGQSGTIVWTPGRVGQFTVATGRDRRGRRAYNGFLGSTGGQMTVAHVMRGDQLCTDWRRSVYDSATIDGGGTGIEIGLASASPTGEGFRLTETNCGGPLPGALAHVLPKVHLSGTQLRRGRLNVDLRGSGSFEDGALRGTVASTVVAHVGTRRRQPSDSAFGRTRSRRFRELDVRYRVEPVHGNVGASFTGGELCDQLASCGDAGTWLLRPRGTGTVGVFVSAPVARPLRDLRAAAGLTGKGDPHGISAGGGGSWSSNSTLAATTTGSRAEDQCSDRRETGAGALQMDRSGRYVNVTIYAGFGITRTSCPGPGLAEDVSGAPLATARVPIAAFAHKRIPIVFRRGVSIATDGWNGQTEPALTIVLRRTSERSSIYRDDG